jgi:hypothetical protein
MSEKLLCLLKLPGVFSASVPLFLVFLTVSLASHAATEVAVGAPITKNNVRFEIIADTFVRIPKAGAETPIKISVRITNADKRLLRFDTFDTIAVSLTDSSGYQLQLDGGRDGLRPGNRFTRQLKPGDNLLIGFAAKLVWASETNLRLIGADGFGGVWYFDNLSPGTYKLAVIYASPAPEAPTKDPTWKGRVVIPAVRVELK